MENPEDKKPKRDYYQVSLKAILENEKGEILGLEAVDKGTMSGFFDLPGGRIDEDEFETPLKTIIGREIIEEAGDINFELDENPVGTSRYLLPGKYTSNKKDTRIFYVFFRAKYISGAISTSEEHKGFKWIDPRNNPEKFFVPHILQGIRTYLS